MSHVSATRKNNTETIAQQAGTFRRSSMSCCENRCVFFRHFWSSGNKQKSPSPGNNTGSMLAGMAVLYRGAGFLPL